MDGAGQPGPVLHYRSPFHTGYLAEAVSCDTRAAIPQRLDFEGEVVEYVDFGFFHEPLP
jgi:hypothetical protein